MNTFVNIAMFKFIVLSIRSVTIKEKILRLSELTFQIRKNRNTQY